MIHLASEGLESLAGNLNSEAHLTVEEMNSLLKQNIPQVFRQGFEKADPSLTALLYNFIFSCKSLDEYDDGSFAEFIHLPATQDFQNSGELILCKEYGVFFDTAKNKSPLNTIEKWSQLRPCLSWGEEDSTYGGCLKKRTMKLETVPECQIIQKIQENNQRESELNNFLRQRFKSSRHS